jgi:hypothetical protein
MFFLFDIHLIMEKKIDKNIGKNGTNKWKLEHIKVFMFGHLMSIVCFLGFDCGRSCERRLTTKSTYAHIKHQTTID